MRKSDGLGRELRERIDQIVADAVGPGQAPGVVAGVAHGDARHVAVSGTLALAGEPMRRDSLFRISSMTKPMTAAAVLSQVEAGLLELGEPVDRLLPRLRGRPLSKLWVSCAAAAQSPQSSRSQWRHRRAPGQSGARDVQLSARLRTGLMVGPGVMAQMFRLSVRACGHALKKEPDHR